MTHGTNRRRVRSLYFGRIVGCPVCNYESGDLFGIYRKSPTARSWRLKNWRIIHHAGSPCTPFWRTSCDVSKDVMSQSGSPFQWGCSGRSWGFAASGDWSILASDFPEAGRYIDPHFEPEKFIEKYGPKAWTEAVGPQLASLGRAAQRKAAGGTT